MSNFIAQVLSTVPKSHSVTYSCRFTNKWSSESHPVNYPENAHWSAPVVAAHSRKYTMWKEDRLASDGVKIVAETGDPGTLQEEVGEARNKNEAGDVITGDVQYNSDQQEQILDDIAMTPWFNKLSSITMVGPSSDWYTGFYNMNPVDKSSKVWYESFEIATYPWDAGTDKGDDARVPIQQLTNNTVPVLAMALWSCTLTGNSSCVNNDNAMKGNGKNRKDCYWAGEENVHMRTTHCESYRYKRRHWKVWCPLACRECTEQNPSG